MLKETHSFSPNHGSKWDNNDHHQLHFKDSSSVGTLPPSPHTFYEPGRIILCLRHYLARHHFVYGHTQCRYDWTIISFQGSDSMAVRPLVCDRMCRCGNELEFWLYRSKCAHYVLHLLFAILRLLLCVSSSAAFFNDRLYKRLRSGYTASFLLFLTIVAAFCHL